MGLWGRKIKSKFNHDLLLENADQDIARHRWPTVFHVLNYPALRDVFVPHDDCAKRAKQRGRKAGFLSIGLGCLALFAASSEHLLQGAGQIHVAALISLVSEKGAATIAPYEPSISGTVAGIAAAAGVISVGIGAMGVLYAGRKREWLEERMVAERIRQFHFTDIAIHLPQILRSLSSDTAQAEYRAGRDIRLSALRADIETNLGAKLTATLRNEDETIPGLDLFREPDASCLEDEGLAPVFEAYRELRIHHQLSYADVKLQEDDRIFSPNAKRQSAMFSFISALLIVALFLIHIGVIVGVLSSAAIRSAFTSDAADVIIIWVAVGALAIRALEAGLQPDREVERYQGYRSAIRAVLKRYNTAGTGAERYRVMLEMERLSFDEMRNFLLTNDRSRFII